MIKKLAERLLAVLLLAATTFAVVAQDAPVNTWPREIEIPGGVVVIYQPQPEKLEGNVLAGRTAVAVEMDNLEQPIFGAVWFNARLETDRDESTATLEVVDARAAAVEGLNKEPPEILVTRKPTVLVVIDGQPQLRDVDGSKLQRVINTPFTILHDDKGGTWHLYASEDSGYVADDLKSDWTLSHEVR